MTERTVHRMLDALTLVILAGPLAAIGYLQHPDDHVGDRSKPDHGHHY